MKSLQDYLLEDTRYSSRNTHNIDEEYAFVVCEGLDIDWINKKVSVSDKHQRLIDTSIENNSTLNNNIYPGIEIWSIFSRKKDDNIKIDGNPLIRAMKKQEGWTFYSERDKRYLINRIKEVMEKYNKEHKHCSAIIVPSKNPLNNLIAGIYNDINPDIKIIKNIYRKMTTDEVYEYIVNTDNTVFRKKYGYSNKVFQSKLDDLNVALEIMDKKHNGIFSYHEVKDKELRNVIEKTLTVENPKLIGLYGAQINNMDILIIDDTISRGATIKQTIEMTKEYFMPKSISVLTLFSSLKK